MMNWDGPPNSEDGRLLDLRKILFRYGLATAIFYVISAVISYFGNFSETSDATIKLVLTIAWAIFISPPSTLVKAWGILKLGWENTLRYNERPLFYAKNAVTKLWRAVPISAILRFGKIINSTYKQTFSERRLRRPYYKYKPLKGPEEIRLLRLSRGLPFTQLSCKLEPSKPGSTPIYESISYTWGDPEKIRQVAIDSCVMDVTQNVYDVLRGRRSFWINRWIWIDAICIKQTDLEEKSEQVRRMQDIYCRASRVVVWLGHSDDAQLAINFIMELWNDLQKISKQPEPASLMTALARDIGKSENTAKSGAVLSLFRQPWFNRVWVIQEVVVAVPVHVVYSGRYLSFDILMCVMDFFTTPEMVRTFPPISANKVEPMPIAFHNGRHLMNLRMDHVLKKPILMEDVITACSRYHATDPRDKVFALVGMVSHILDESILPDYKKSVSEVYMNMAKYLLTRKYLVQTLPDAGIGHSRKITDIPSWIPDWSNVPDVYRLSNLPNVSYVDYSSSGQTQAQVQLHEESNMITVRGICIDQITKLASALADTISRQTELEVFYNDTSRVRAWHQELLEIACSGTTDPYQNGQAQQEAFWRTLIGDRTADGQLAPAIYAEYYQLWVQHHSEAVQQLVADVRDLQIRMLHTIFIQGEFISRDDFQQQFINQFQERTKDLGLDPGFEGDPDSRRRKVSAFQIPNGQHSFRRRFAVTRNGYMALVPPGSREGDTICILFGAQTPSVLRRYRNLDATNAKRNLSTEEGEENVSYSFLGECYVHGVMDGEMIDGDYNAKSESFTLR